MEEPAAVWAFKDEIWLYPSYFLSFFLSFLKMALKMPLANQDGALAHQVWPHKLANSVIYSSQHCCWKNQAAAFPPTAANAWGTGGTQQPLWGSDATWIEAHACPFRDRQSLSCINRHALPCVLYEMHQCAFCLYLKQCAWLIGTVSVNGLGQG